MPRRGFIAEINHQIKLEAQRQANAQREAERRRAAAAREAERTRKQEERAAQALRRATEAERKQMEKEARESHVVAMEAKVAELNSDLDSTYSDIDGLLQATLEVDDYVDLETLRAPQESPLFDRPDLETPSPEPTPPVKPVEPARPAPTAPMWFRIVARKRHRRRLEEHGRWSATVAKLAADHRAACLRWQQAERLRTAALAKERDRYERECRERAAKATQRNEAVDALIVGLGYGTPAAVEEYVSIVLSNSVYPPAFPVEHEFEFDVATAELRLRALVPGPATIPTIKSYRYHKSSDEIVSNSLAAKACKDRYASALNQVALRTLHEIFEADRRGIIKSISLEVSTATVNPATGNHEIFCLVAVGADRDTFQSLNLSNVVPEATLAHLGAVISKNPTDLVAVDKGGVRRS